MAQLLSVWIPGTKNKWCLLVVLLKQRDLRQASSNNTYFYVKHSATLEHQIVTTKDQSHTLYVPELNEHYHSTHGAVNESEHVFIKNGLLAIHVNPVHIFEVGFGTGLNAILTYKMALEKKLKVLYETIELNPLDPQLVGELNYNNFLDEAAQKIFTQLHELEWGKQHEIHPLFHFRKIHADIFKAGLSSSYHMVYFDAFAPGKQPDIWCGKVFEKIYARMETNGVLVTYCAKGSVKRLLKSIGFEVEAVSGPPGKREMTRARKT